MSRRKKGSGGISKRKDGRWEGRAVVGYDERGLPITKNVLTGSKAECKEKLEALQESIAPKVKTDASPDMTLGEWLNVWFNDYAAPKLKDSTKQTYRYRIYGQIIPNLGSIKLKELTQSDIQSFYAHLKSGGRAIRTEIYGKGLSNAHIRSIHMHVHAALDKAVAEGLITVNPATGCKLPPKKGREMQVLTKEELYRLFLQAKEDGYYELFLLDVSTGMRRGELLALQWEDVDFERSEIRICRQVNRVDGKLVVSEPKTKGSVRTVCLPKPIMNMLKIYEQTAVGKWLFPSPNEPDTPRDPASVRKALSRILKHAGCKHVRFHDLRHTFATLSLENGVDIKTVAEILGHSTVETALNTYTHITEEMKRSAAQKIDLQIARVEPKRGGGEDTAPGSKTQQIAPYEPYRGKIRKRGTGCISHLTENCWQGKYTPRTKDGKREIHAVYAETEEECEQKLAAMIAEIKAESQIS